MPIQSVPSVSSNRVQGLAVLRGVVFTFLCSGVLAGLIALFVYFTSIREQQVAAGLFVAGVMAVVAGGAYAAHRARTTGWLHGGLVGGIYALITILLAPLLFPGSLGFGTVVERLLLGCAAGVLGGILGINI